KAIARVGACVLVSIQLGVKAMSPVNVHALLSTELLNPVENPGRDVLKNYLVRPALGLEFILLFDGLDGNASLLRGFLRFVLEVFLARLDLLLSHRLRWGRTVFFGQGHGFF